MTIIIDALDIGHCPPMYKSDFAWYEFECGLRISETLRNLAVEKGGAEALHNVHEEHHAHWLGQFKPWCIIEQVEEIEYLDNSLVLSMISMWCDCGQAKEKQVYITEREVVGLEDLRKR